MCTVTYIFNGNTIYLTSNRDEKVTRGKAIEPQKQLLENGRQLFFPKDPDSGGTWIGLTNNRDAGVLLNGAFTPHHPKRAYRQSRGLVFLEVVKALAPMEHFKQLRLADIEPFTLILFTENRLYECRWDGCEKFLIELNATDSYIWSSATLYDSAAQICRQQWFETFLAENQQVTQEAILNFHRKGGKGDRQNSLLINRDNKLKTVSITSLQITPHEASLSYFDLQQTGSVGESLVCKNNIIKKSAVFYE